VQASLKRHSDEQFETIKRISALKTYGVRSPGFILEDVVDRFTIHSISFLIYDVPCRGDLLLSAVIIDPSERYPLLQVKLPSKVLETLHRNQAAWTRAKTAVSNQRY
jgi:hypothetical protein